MSANSLKAIVRSDSTTVTLTECQAILPDGAIADITTGPGVSPLSAEYAHGNEGDSAFVFLARGLQKERIDAGTAASPSDIPYLHIQYDLFVSATDNSRSALAVGRLKRENGAFVLDSDYIPPCLYLDSHWVLQEYVKKAITRACTCIDKSFGHNILDEHRLKLLISTLIPISFILDWKISPEAYLEKCISTIMAHVAVLPQKDQRVPRLAGNLQALGFRTYDRTPVKIDLNVFFEAVIRSLDDLESLYKARGAT
jgi:hypothetical protein